jgi:hypothetical protein
VRQEDRRYTFVDNLVDSSTQIVSAIWPLSAVFPRNRLDPRGILPLRTFIQETLRRSKTSYSTLQVALYYLILIKPHVPKFDFTMEQPDDVCSNRSFQCGRRMFLAALILASKYLQDRNYSARAWSKISGLNVHEINQNEMMFLLAIDWKLHVANETYLRWTQIVRKYTPPMPPSPPSPGGITTGSSALVQSYEVRLQEWRTIILGLSPQLDNLAALVPPRSPLRATTFPPSPIASAHSDLSAFGLESETASSSLSSTPTLHPAAMPAPLEPSLPSPYHHQQHHHHQHQRGPAAPCLLRLPTPRLTPQPPRLSTPAAGAPHPPASSSIRGSAMAMAVAQANNSLMSQFLTRATTTLSSPPSHHMLRRRPSIAASSTVSSPESMVSDSSRSSRSSRSSSISSASSSAPGAPPSLGVQARLRLARLCSERSTSSRPVVVSAPEDYPEFALTSSPETYVGALGKMCASLEADTPLGQREMELDAAARVLTELHHNRAVLQTATMPTTTMTTPTPMPMPNSRPSLKRSRGHSNELHDNVREMLLRGTGSGWSEALVRPRVPGAECAARKRARIDVGSCGQKVATPGFVVDYTTWQPPAVGMPGPGMWHNIL